MKILEIEIENVRGIRDKIQLLPKGNNLVISGPNGAGKSAIVDAIDFVFTGDISRLKGRGSKGMSLKKHGAHIDSQPKDAIVRVSIEIDGAKAPVTLERKMSKPKELIILNSENDEIIHDIVDFASTGQHVLSRSEILKFIAAEAGTRATEIQAILKLDDVENVRKLLVATQKESNKMLRSTKTNLETTQSGIASTLNIDQFTENVILNKINEIRNVLKVDPLTSLDYTKLKEGISPLSVQDSGVRINPEKIEASINTINLLIKDKGQLQFKMEQEIRNAIKDFLKNEKLMKNLKSVRLLSLGISLIDESGVCPLCLTEWEKGELQPRLQDRFLSAKEAEGINKDIQSKMSKANTTVATLRGHLEIITDAARKLMHEGDAKELEEWASWLDTWSESLNHEIDKYPVSDVDDIYNSFGIPVNWAKHCNKLSGLMDVMKKVTPEQEAWDILTGLEEQLKRYKGERDEYERMKELDAKAELVSQTYTETKDRILGTLYDSIKEDFITYYKCLHSEDENGFCAELTSEGPELDLKVDFYGRGTHHPRALHSEGHQDSMGLCLYLALNKRISEDKVKLIILDDVVMSIDNGHRRNVCKLLNEYFPDNQFIITTHNRTWARQLRTEGIVGNMNMIEFKRWSVKNGPKLAIEVDVWDGIRAKLENNDIASAAHQLREHAEYFYEGVCDSLMAEVRYKGDNRWDLGDFLRGAKKAFKDNLKQAKKAANSWGKDKERDEYTILETQFREIVQQTQSEQWGINENVHYSKWADFSKEDFLPIVEAFEDLESFYKCPHCDGLISLNMKGMAHSNIKCPCGEFLWNLEPKNKTA